MIIHKFNQYKNTIDDTIISKANIKQETLTQKLYKPKHSEHLVQIYILIIGHAKGPK